MSEEGTMAKPEVKERWEGNIRRWLLVSLPEMAVYVRVDHMTWNLEFFLL